jgi:DNA replicative helicase MCM subunit Mcm2 (Cdc46/Mcm family)
VFLRFDLIFLILDQQDEVYDKRLARHLVSLYYRYTHTQTIYRKAHAASVYPKKPVIYSDLP